jgi:hypothetical protein
MESDGIAEPNIEIILSQIRALSQVVGTGTVKGFTKEDLTELDEQWSFLVKKFKRRRTTKTFAFCNGRSTLISQR